MRSMDELDVQMAREESQHWIAVADAATTRAKALEAALKRLLLEFDFMIERGIGPGP